MEQTIEQDDYYLKTSLLPIKQKIPPRTLKEQKIWVSQDASHPKQKKKIKRLNFSSSKKKIWSSKSLQNIVHWYR